MIRSEHTLADVTWEPITGCEENCEYCNARETVNQVSPHAQDCQTAARYAGFCKNGLFSVCLPWAWDGKELRYPFGFAPTFHRYRLTEPVRIKKPQNILVCGETDMFADWVPDQWITDVFRACLDAPQHRFLFSTCFPERYVRLREVGKLPRGSRFQYGITAVCSQQETQTQHVGQTIHRMLNCW